MSNIITNEEFKTFRNITYKVDESKITISITQAHTDLREVLGDAFYFDVIKNQGSYSELLDGFEFEVDGNEYIHEGLKSLLADYAYSRYLYEINITHSPFGMVQKTNQDSEPLDRNMIKDLVKQVNMDASRKWELIRVYLDANKETYKVWAEQEPEDTEDGTGFNKTRFTFLSTNRYN
jgi:hypothetical protein